MNEIPKSIINLSLCNFHKCIKGLYTENKGLYTESKEYIQQELEEFQHYSDEAIILLWKYSGKNEKVLFSFDREIYLQILKEVDYLEYFPENDKDKKYYTYDYDYIQNDSEFEKEADKFLIDDPLFKKYLGIIEHVTMTTKEDVRKDVESEEELVLVDEEYTQDLKNMQDEASSMDDLELQLSKLLISQKKKKNYNKNYNKNYIEQIDLKINYCTDLYKLCDLVYEKEKSKAALKNEEINHDEFRKIFYETLDEFFPL